jgi:hypothetical protein
MFFKIFYPFIYTNEIVMSIFVKRKEYFIFSITNAIIMFVSFYRYLKH